MSRNDGGSQISRILRSIIIPAEHDKPRWLHLEPRGIKQASSTAPLTFLGLPLEIRYMIFELLYSNGPVCYIYPNSSITSISHRGPPRSLLLACRQLRDQVRDHYYSYVTFRFSVFGFLPVKSNSADSQRVIRRARKIEFMLVWNVTKNGLMGEPSWNEGWLVEHLDMVKNEGHLLTTVIISLRDASKGAGWDKKVPLLESFRTIKGKVRFAVGEVIVGEDVQDDIRYHLGRYVQELNR